VLSIEKYDLIQLLLKNRFKVFYCTLLHQAQDKADKDKIREEMRQSDEGREVLEQLENRSTSRRAQM
jgi:pre-mRNA-splicing helicase BRR2